MLSVLLLPTFFHRSLWSLFCHLFLTAPDNVLNIDQRLSHIINWLSYQMTCCLDWPNWLNCTPCLCIHVLYFWKLCLLIFVWILVCKVCFCKIWNQTWNVESIKLDTKVWGSYSFMWRNRCQSFHIFSSQRYVGIWSNWIGRLKTAYSYMTINQILCLSKFASLQLNTKAYFEYIHFH